MPDPLAGLPPRFLRTPEAARFLGLSGRTLKSTAPTALGRNIERSVVASFMVSTTSRPGPISAPRAQPPIPAPEPCFLPSEDPSRLDQRSIAADRSRARSRHLKTRSRDIRSDGDITV
jgi:hypothetical protein